MGMYFCDGCQRYRDSKEHGFSETSLDEDGRTYTRQLCDECEFEREEAMREMIAEGVANHIRETEARHVH